MKPPCWHAEGGLTLPYCNKQKHPWNRCSLHTFRIAWQQYVHHKMIHSCCYSPSTHTFNLADNVAKHQSCVTKQGNAPMWWKQTLILTHNQTLIDFRRKAHDCESKPQKHIITAHTYTTKSKKKTQNKTLKLKEKFKEENNDVKRHLFGLNLTLVEFRIKAHNWRKPQKHIGNYSLLSHSTYTTKYAKNQHIQIEAKTKIKKNYFEVVAKKD